MKRKFFMEKVLYEAIKDFAEDYNLKGDFSYDDYSLMVDEYLERSETTDLLNEYGISQSINYLYNEDTFNKLKAEHSQEQSIPGRSYSEEYTSMMVDESRDNRDMDLLITVTQRMDGGGDINFLKKKISDEIISRLEEKGLELTEDNIEAEYGDVIYEFKQEAIERFERGDRDILPEQPAENPNLITKNQNYDPDKPHGSYEHDRNTDPSQATSPKPEIQPITQAPQQPEARQNDYTELSARIAESSSILFEQAKETEEMARIIEHVQQTQNVTREEATKIVEAQLAQLQSQFNDKIESGELQETVENVTGEFEKEFNSWIAENLPRIEEGMVTAMENLGTDVQSSLLNATETEVQVGDDPKFNGEQEEIDQNKKEGVNRVMSELEKLLNDGDKKIDQEELDNLQKIALEEGLRLSTYNPKAWDPGQDTTYIMDNNNKQLQAAHTPFISDNVNVREK